MAAINRGVRESLQSSGEDAVRLTLELSDHVIETVDCAEGITAFFEKREQRFEGKRIGDLFATVCRPLTERTG